MRGAMLVGSAQVFVMHEELVQVGKRTDPAEAEETWRWPRPDAGDEPFEIATLRETYPPLLREALEWAGEYQAGGR